MNGGGCGRFHWRFHALWAPQRPATIRFAPCGLQNARRERLPAPFREFIVDSNSVESEWELQAETHDGVVFDSVVAGEVVCTVSEDAKAVGGGEASLKATTEHPMSSARAVGAVTATSKDVRSNADAVDRSAKDKSSVKVVVFLVRSVEAIGTLDRDVAVDGIFSKNAAAESVFVVEDGATEHTDAKARAEAIATDRSLRWHHWGFRALGGNRASEDGTCEAYDGEEGNN